MKVKNFLYAVALISCICACKAISEEDGVNPAYLENRLTAYIEPEEETRTSLSPQGNHRSSVLWSEGDEIGVFLDGASTAKTFTLSDGAGTKQGVFTGKGRASEYVAFYPYSMVPGLSGKTIHFSLPYEQTYEAGSFANGSYPMAAAGSSSELQFRNLSSVLKLSLTGHHSVTRIVFRSNDPSVKVAGQASVSMDNPDNPVLMMASSGVDSLVLHVSSVQLKQDEATDFYLSLPPQTYKKGFTVRIYTGERYMDKSLETDFTLVRSRLHAATAFDFVPNGYDISITLDGSGTEVDPFLLRSVGDLVLMQEAVNSGSSIKGVEACMAAYKLMADIDLSPVCGVHTNKNWTPVGSLERPFNGLFDGGNHRMTGLYINHNLWSPNMALFAVVKGGTIVNLALQGTVITRGDRTALLIARAYNSTVSYCSVEGDSEGDYYVGGILGEGDWSTTLSYCVNRANIKGIGRVGGVCGEADGDVLACVNYGMVIGQESIGGIGGLINGSTFNCSNFGYVEGSGDNVGGVAGFQNDGVIANCANEGSITGRDFVGGVTGRSHQGSYVWNNVNRGNVSGQDVIGGITGWLSSTWSHEGECSDIRNCINLGDVTGSSENKGGICGWNEGKKEDEEDEEEYVASEIINNYWLYDSYSGIGMATGIGRDEGVSKENYSLSCNEMKGSDCSTALYLRYNKVLDALNIFAYQKLRHFRLARLWGWKVDEKDGYPVLTALDAQSFGSDGSVFSVSSAFVQLASAQACQFSVDVTSTAEYNVFVPEWISISATIKSETSPYVQEYVFSVGFNDSGSVRKGEIRFVNSEGKEMKVYVNQKGAYLDIDVHNLQFTASGATKRIDVTSSLSWSITCDASWLVINPSQGQLDAEIEVMALENDNPEARNAKVSIVSSEGAISQIIQISQSGKKQGDGGSGGGNEGINPGGDIEL